MAKAKATITPVVPIEREVVLTLTESEARHVRDALGALRATGLNVSVYEALDELYLG